MSILDKIKTERDVDTAIRSICMNVLAEHDTSFALVAVRCNSEDSVGKRKLIPHQIYYLMEGYSVDGCEPLPQWRNNLNHLYDDYLVTDSAERPHVQISAIVGQNGAGKSSLVEFIMRLINNFAAITFGEYKTGPVSERLHYISGIDGDLWYIIDYIMYRLHVKGNAVELYRIGDTREENNSQDEFLYESFCCNGDRENTLHERIDEFDLRRIYDSFFYTLISNHSLYAYNTNDYRAESDSDEKAKIARKYAHDEISDNEHRNWLHGLFHKNDGYQTPMVITPFRHEGNIDINKENSLANERLITLLIKHRSLRVINGHLTADSLAVDGEKGHDYGFKFLKRELGMLNLGLKEYNAMRGQILSLWGEKVEDDLTKYSTKPYYDLAVNYLTYKTLKIALYYKHHDHKYHAGPFERLASTVGGYNPQLVEEIVELEFKDQSHITRKIHQTLGYLLYDVYSPELSEDHTPHGFIFDNINRRWSKNAIMSLDMAALRSPFRVSVATMSLVPPPFLKSTISLRESSDQSVRIDFATLSSGERQQCYAVSSILYHLDNLDSVERDESAPLRIPYKNVVLILEEIELYFHPELQQQFAKQLLDGIKQLELSNIRNIHIIFVTHSPYVLSDVPKENVLALTKEGHPSPEKLKTFCANIHEMLKDSFFLSRGAQGAFAQWEVGHLMACIDVHRRFRKARRLKRGKFKIPADKDVYGFLDRYGIFDKEYKTREFSYEAFCIDFSEENLRMQIDVIDEPLLRDILTGELNEAMQKTEAEMREMRMRELEDELRRLKAEQ